jgi:penicillin G amidase
MRWATVFVACGVACGVAGGVLTGCGVDTNVGPFDGLPLDGDFVVGTAAPVHVARDTAGVAHIAASSIADAAFVQGFVMAHDRLPQMDVLRRFAAGTLAELYGVMDPAVIDSDLEMRMYRLGPRAQASWDAMTAAGGATDQRVIALLERFTAGVNAYAEALQRGTWRLEPAIAASWDPAQFVAWSPIDSLLIVQLDAFAQWWSAPRELDATERYQGLRQTYDLATDVPAAAARRGLSRDLLRLAPIGRAPTIDGFPNVTSDTGSRSDGRGPTARSVTAAADPARPVVPQDLLDGARTVFGRGAHTGALGALGPQAFLYGDGGSATAVASRGGRVLLAGDPRAPLSYPSAFYPTHLIVAVGDDQVDLLGVTVPGVPGILLGSNGHVAWSATTSHHDVNDLYLEQIAPCAAGSCVAWTDPAGAAHPIPIETFGEDIRIGALGVIRATTHVTYETTPHHGVLVPVIDRAHHTLTPRTGTAALALRTPGDAALAFELRALDNLARATTVADGLRALGDAAASGRSWTLIDRGQHLGWTSHATLPIRAPAAYVWDPLTHQDDLAPFFVLPGDGRGDWLDDQALSTRFVPHAIDPAQGYLVASSGDPVGATFDGLPLNQGVVDGDPLYAGVDYGDGLHAAQITAGLQARAAAEPGGMLDLTVAELAAVQDDPRSRLGAQLVPAILAALERLDEDGPPADVAPYLAVLPAADRARLVTARARLAAWSFDTPVAASGDSAATAIFHTWLARFTERTLADELDGIGVPLARVDDNQRARVIHAMLTDPRSFITSPATQQPILCDNYPAVGPDDSCTKVILEAMVDAMTFLESPAGFGTADTGAWPWGQLHALALTSVVPGVPAPPGVPLAGDDLAADRAPGSLAADGPALRWTAEADGQGITVKWALPGGVIFDGRSAHARDQLDRAYLPGAYLEAPATVAQIVAAGETHWVFH